jgi:hypothetical protein
VNRLFAFLLLAAASSANAADPANYLFLGGDDLASRQSLLERADIAGAQRVYTWRSLEPKKGEYDFSAIERDLALTEKLHKKLFIQVQDRFFSAKDRNVPDYLLSDPQYDGGLAAQFDNPGEGKAQASGWVAKQWSPAVRERFQALLKALAERFDGRVAGINLPETAADLTPSAKASGFSCDSYFDGELANAAYARRVFTRSTVVQYVNFWPCEWNNDHHYMERTFAFAAAQGIGLGGPDIVPFKKGQMKNSYPFFHQYRGRLKLVAMAVQEPTLTYTNPQTGKHFTRDDFVSFARDYLGANIIFWTPQAPWLRRPSPGLAK